MPASDESRLLIDAVNVIVASNTIGDVEERVSCDSEEDDEHGK